MRFNRHRRDNNHKDIVKRLEELGCSVLDLSQVGGGCPDLLVGLLGRDYLVEVKEVGKQPSPEQIDWHRDWRGQPVTVIWTEEQCVAWTNNVRRRIIDAFR